ncbi:MAG: site-specific integrase [Bacteroidetes bacterium]|nr:MAG: site-specific integrase [Bacteroidota bacterium]
MEKYKTAKLFDANGDIDQRWFVFYYFRNPDTGKFERFREWIPLSIKSRSGRRDKAHQLISRINMKLRQGFNPYAHKEKRFTNIIDAMNFVLEVKRSFCRDRTYHTYKYLVKYFIEWLKTNQMSSYTIEDFSYYHAQDFLDNAKRDKGITNRTYNYMAMHMKTFFNLLVKREWILANPFQRIEKLPEEEAEIAAFSKEELSIMQKFLPEYDYNLYVVACLIFYCFLRPQEIMRLRVSHIHLSAGTIILPGHVSKNKKQDVVQIPNGFKKVLARFDMNYPPDYLLFTRKLQRGTKPAAPTRIAEYWRAFANTYGIPKKIYSLKHTGVGMAVDSGINLRDLQLQLRHSSLDMTQRYLDRFRRRPSDKLINGFPELE